VDRPERLIDSKEMQSWKNSHVSGFTIRIYSGFSQRNSLMLPAREEEL
jgi:hypothetical protein